jgi:hypothetical protein
MDRDAVPYCGVAARSRPVCYQDFVSAFVSRITTHGVWIGYAGRRRR